MDGLDDNGSVQQWFHRYLCSNIFAEPLTDLE